MGEFIAVMSLHGGRSTFRIPGENYEDPDNVVLEECERLAERLGLQFLFLEFPEEDQ